MKTFPTSLFLGLGVIAGGLIAIQSVLNTALGKLAKPLGSLLVLTAVSLSVLIVLALFVPGSVQLKHLPPLSMWYLYSGAVLGIAILAAPILLVPRIGTTSTLVMLVLGQLGVSIMVDHWGLLASPKIEVTSIRIVGVVLVVVGAFLVSSQRA